MSFTLCRDPAAESRIERELASVAQEVTVAAGGGLLALLLVGSYARGEGGVRRRGDGLGADNDYDLVAVVRRSALGLRDRLRRAAARCSERLGLEVTVFPVTLATLRAPPRTLFWLDIAAGGARVLCGDAGILAQLPPIDARAVPLEECGRLLANRAVGLALSNLDGPWASPEWQVRHGHKAALACGDVRLVAVDRYRTGIRARLAELEALGGAPDVSDGLVTAYRDAIRYRTVPDEWHAPDPSWYRSLRASVMRWHLEFEAWRVGAPADVVGFVRWRGRLFEHLDDVRPGGALAASLRASLRRAAPFTPYLGHPRERLARVAVALAYGQDDPDARAAASELLGLRGREACTEVTARLRTLVDHGG